MEILSIVGSECKSQRADRRRAPISPQLFSSSVESAQIGTSPRATSLDDDGVQDRAGTMGGLSALGTAVFSGASNGMRRPPQLTRAPGPTLTLQMEVVAVVAASSGPPGNCVGALCGSFLYSPFSWPSLGPARNRPDARGIAGNPN
ncbi:hypothetical protein B0H17DRAFT_1127621 [Mycena rosella]|uniref:Uncharacterized protein n=1 Tax=Mycena rosella TaxID=1033263 RepID=A0AAD7DYF1_MYCRO|nr:hypothetical protein B0H17DRAFT_1127621 [Mycena rosella]